MVVIVNKYSDTISKSKNLAQLRRHAGKWEVETVEIVERSNGSGLLRVLFKNGDSCKTDFADFTVLRGWVKRWRNVRHAEHIINTRAKQ